MLAPPAEARFVWPWDHAPARHARPAAPPDCGRINEAVRTLEPERPARALRFSTRQQREIIARCAQPEPH